MEPMRQIITLIFGFLVLFPVTTTANDINPNTANEVQRAENYLRNLGTVKADFIQRAGEGAQLSGTFYLNRPGKLRFEYNEVDDFIVADGLFIYFYDSEMKEQTNAPIGQTLADFLLRKDLSLTEDLRVQDIQDVPSYKILTLVERDDEASGAVKLFFSKAPYALKKWQVIDATGLTTEITLNNMQRDVELRPALFAYIAPKSDKPSYNE